MEIAALLKEHQQLNFSDILNYDKFNQYAITHHSTAIEGSTSTEIETNLLQIEGFRKIKP